MSLFKRKNKIHQDKSVVKVQNMFHNFNHETHYLIVLELVSGCVRKGSKIQFSTGELELDEIEQINHFGKTVVLSCLFQKDKLKNVEVKLNDVRDEYFYVI